MKRQTVIIAFLLTLYFVKPWAAPVPVKSLKADQETTQSCVFDSYDKAVPEVFPPRSKSAYASCDTEMLSLQKIYEHRHDFEKDLLGAENPIDLIMTRVGIFKTKEFWEDETQLNEVLSGSVCLKHWKELFSQWSSIVYHHLFRDKDRNVVCGYPTELGTEYHDGSLVKSDSTLRKTGAYAIFKEHNKVLQAGIGLCKEHTTEVNDMITKYFQKNSNEPEACLVEKASSVDKASSVEKQCEEEIAAQKLEERKTTIQDFILNLHYSRLVTREYDSLSLISLERKTRSAKKLFLEIAGVIAPNKAAKFVDDVCMSYGIVSKDKNYLDTICNQVAKEYTKAGSDKLLRMFAIGSVVNVVSYPELRKYIPHLTEYMYREAKNLLRESDIPRIEKRRHYQRYEKEEIKKFINFVTSPTCLISLPYGIQHVKLSDKTVIDIPHTIRIQRHAEIIRMYTAKRKAEDANYKPLPRSTAFTILHHCYAKRSKALTCVDYFLAMGYEAFDFLETAITEWINQGSIPALDGDVLKKRLRDGRLYLRTDFNILLKPHSPVLSHCITYALSDAKGNMFRKQCESNPAHTVLCERCEQLKNALFAVEKFASEQCQLCRRDPKCTQYEAEECDIREVLVKDAVFDITEMKKHLVRTRYSEIQRKLILDDIDESSALITLDFAQKLLPRKFYEKQRDYFGKKGLSYHISHVLSKKSGEFVEHSYVHLLSDSLQDTASVTAIIVDVLKNVSKCGITKVVLRSDNAGCYHSRDMVLSLNTISELTGVQIMRWAFSEPQAGKSSCDRKAANVKNRVRDYVDEKNDVTDPAQFFQSLISPFPLKFTTMSQSIVQNRPRRVLKEKAITGISGFYDFIPNGDGVRAYKFYGIGTGKVFKYADYPVTQDLPYLDHVQTNNTLDIHTDCSRNFWRSSAMLVGRKRQRKGQKTTFHCPEDLCDATFNSNDELEAHLIADIHKDREPDQLTFRDYVVLQFFRAVEELSNTADDPIEAAIRQNVMDDSELKNLDGVVHGWGQRSARNSPKFTADSKNFLAELFVDGEDKSHKLTGAEAVKLMIDAKTETGERRFRAHELLRAEQITSFFSRYSAQRKKESNGPKAKKRKLNKKAPRSLPDENNNESDEETSNDDVYSEELLEIQYIEIEEMIANIENELF